MYTTDYLQTFIDALALPEESRAPLRADYETLLAAPGALDELRAAEALLFGGADWEAIWGTFSHILYISPQRHS